LANHNLYFNEAEIGLLSISQKWLIVKETGM